MKNNLKILVVDGSGRGAALVHAYSKSPLVSQIFAVPGNELMQINSKVPVRIFPELKTTSVSEIVEICKNEKIDLVDVAQDNAVEAGVTNALLLENIQVVGPTREAGQIEWDKGWSRDFMKKYDLPVPIYKVFHSTQDAKDFIQKESNTRWFIKAAGLAEGKGAIPAETKREALEAIDRMAQFGKSGETFVIEEWLEGEEFSMFAVTDGETHQIVGSAQDHKRLYTGDKGPNTGGMGCSTPPLIVDAKIYSQGEDILKRAIEGLKKEGRVYKGVLYLGGIVVNGNVSIIEFNARWGSPEAEVLVPSITNDMVEVAFTIIEGKLKDIQIKTDGKARVVVAGALKPEAKPMTREIFGIDNVIKLPGITLYGARVTKKGEKYFVSSGRLFQLVAEGLDVLDARKKAYEAMSKLSIEGDNLHYRTDIGWRDVERLRQ